MQKLIPFLLILFLVSCSTNTLIEKFYFGNGVLQYFIIPMDFKSEFSNVSLDFTFRDNKDSVTFNFTLNNANNLQQNLKKVLFINSTDTILIKNSSLIYNDRDINQIRYTSKISYKDLQNIFSNEKIQFLVNYNSTTTKYISNNSFEKVFLQMKSILNN